MDYSTVLARAASALTCAACLAGCGTFGSPASQTAPALAPQSSVPDVSLRHLASASSPWGVAKDFRTGDVYFSEWRAGEIWRITPDGKKTMIAKGFLRPEGIAWNAANDKLYVAESGGHAIRSVTASGVVGTVVSDLSALGTPADVAFDESNQDMFVADPGHNKVHKYDANLKRSDWGTGFSRPHGVAVNY